MGRPVKLRKIENFPKTTCFVPTKDVRLDIEGNILLLEEVEAIRLKDLEGLEQADCAERMEVSRPTFQRILLSAREKIADALIAGKAIQLGGGNYTRNICTVVCMDCGATWKVGYEEVQKFIDGQSICPVCDSKDIRCEKACSGTTCIKCCYKKTEK